MIDELYTYACPAVSSESKKTNIFLILSMTLASLVFIGFMGNTVLCIAVTASYLLLSFLSLLDKDLKSRFLKVAILSVLDVLVLGMFVLSKVFSNYLLSLWIIILGTIFSLSYEIVVFVKIKNKLYSCPKKAKRSSLAIKWGLIIVLFSLFRNVFRNNPIFQKLDLLIMILCLSFFVVVFIMLLQKLIIYLFTRNKVQINFEDVKETDEIDKKS